MSLILDALKKSEAERRRGLPPTLASPYLGPVKRRSRPWAAVAGGVVMLAGGFAGGWWWMQRDHEGPSLVTDHPEAAAWPAPAAQETPTLAAGTPAPPPADAIPAAVARTESFVATAEVARPAEAVAVGLGTPTGFGQGGSASGGGLPLPQRAGLYTPTAVPATSSAAASEPQQPVIDSTAALTDPGPQGTTLIAEPIASGEGQTKPDPMLAGDGSEARPDAAVASGEGRTKPEAVVAIGDGGTEQVAMVATSASEPPPVRAEHLPQVFQLPYGLRKELPKLDLSMHVYSPVVEERFIVLNGKRFSVGGPAPGPELQLVDIVDGGAVLEFRGQRFLLPRQIF